METFRHFLLTVLKLAQLSCDQKEIYRQAFRHLFHHVSSSLNIVTNVNKATVDNLTSDTEFIIRANFLYQQCVLSAARIADGHEQYKVFTVICLIKGLKYELFRQYAKRMAKALP